MLATIETLATYFTGLVVLFNFVVFVIISIPIYLYRYILQHVIVPRWFSETVAKTVDATSVMFATEFLDNYPPRCCIVTNFVFEGEIPVEEVEQELKHKWLSDKNYPEFQQYIQSWMGFLFWHKDKSFDLSNHLFRHKIPDGEDSKSSERWICDKIEELLNKPFHPKRGPWEVHVIENYVNTDLNGNEDVKLTAFIMRFHHGLADGFGLMYAVIEKLFGQPLAKLDMATPSKASNSPPPSTSTVSRRPNLLNYYKLLLPYVKLAQKLIYDVGWFNNLILRPSTQWHVPDNKKRWKQIYARSELIPIDRLKGIKNRLGGSFTGVIFSLISAGVSKSLHGKGENSYSSRVDSLAASTVLPLPGHPKKLTNHATATVFDLPTEPDMDPVTRLRRCEEELQLAKQSTIPFFSVLLFKLLGSHLAPVAKLLLANRVIPMGLSNFPGPGKEIEWNGRKGLSTDFIVGGVNGVAGVGFMVLSYRNHIRIAASAENAVMEKDELGQLINYMCEEIENLEAAQ